MALFNYATRELSAKIVYYGPGLSGKTTNIEMVHKMLRPEQKGRLISLPTETDRTLFFDFLPIELGQIKGFKVRFHLYTVPGQVFYNATRRLVLQGVDGVVFVADSQREMVNGNMESLKNLMDNLSSYGKKLEELPFVLQYNKRDLRNAAPVAELDAALNFLHVPTLRGGRAHGQGGDRDAGGDLQDGLRPPPEDPPDAGGDGGARRYRGSRRRADPEDLHHAGGRAARGDLRRRGDPGRGEERPPRRRPRPPSAMSTWSRPRFGPSQAPKPPVEFEELSEIEVESSRKRPTARAARRGRPRRRRPARCPSTRRGRDSPSSSSRRPSSPPKGTPSSRRCSSTRRGTRSGCGSG